MLAEAGRAVVSRGLVDSYFGNISYVLGDNILISQTGSSLDELEGCIDMAPLDGSSSSGITASSELSAHRNIFLQTGERAILHGHPKFSVIMSMYCNKERMPSGQTATGHARKRGTFSILPIVPGEIGTGGFRADEYRAVSHGIRQRSYCLWSWCFHCGLRQFLRAV